MTELKPCPFCGNGNVQIKATQQKAWVTCRDCETDGPFCTTDGDAKSQWNARHTPEGYKLVPVELINRLLFAHERSTVDWDAMRELKALISEGEA